MQVIGGEHAQGRDCNCLDEMALTHHWPASAGAVVSSRTAVIEGGRSWKYPHQLAAANVDFGCRINGVFSDVGM